MIGDWTRAGVRLMYTIFFAALLGGIVTPIVSAWNAPDAAPTGWIQTASTPENIALAGILSIIVGLIAAAVKKGGGGF